MSSPNVETTVNGKFNHLMKNVLVVALALSAILIFIFTDYGKNRTVVYDCRDAHWHPDVPVEVKKECSKLMYEQWKKHQEEERVRKNYI